MNRQLEQYIQTHKVSSANFLVFRDWEEFLNVLFSNNGDVEMSTQVMTYLRNSIYAKFRFTEPQ